MAYCIKDVYNLCEEVNLKCISKEYISIKSNLKFICSECNEVFERNFDNLKARKSNICNNCGKKKSNKDRVFTYEYVKNTIESFGCGLISKEYKNIDEKIKIKCKCGDEFETTFYKFTKRNKKQCNKCGRKNTALKTAISKDEIVKMLDIDGYKFLGNKLEGKDQRIYIQCNKNHEPYWVNISKYKSTGRRCPGCQNSKGEKKVKEILSKLGEIHKKEYTFSDLIGIGGGLLRFDFAVFDSRENLKCLIEYDGEMHFEETGIKNDLKRQKIHDSLKNEYCKKNNINLIRIPYWDFERIEQIIINNV